MDTVGDDQFLTEIEGYSHAGEGVGHYLGKPVFIPLAARGEIVRFNISDQKKNYARGRLIEVIKPQPWRTATVCPDYGICGGCDLLHLSYDEQLYFKRQTVIAALQRIGGLAKITVQDVLPMSDPCHYRHTARLHAQQEYGRIELGYYLPKSHIIYPLTGCPLLPMELPAILADLTRLLNAHCGEYPLKEVVVRKGRSTGELMLLLKTRGSNPARTRAVWSELHNLYPGLTGIVISDSSSAAGHGATIVIGQDYYSEVVSGVRFHVPAAAFFQNNPEQTEVLLQQVKTFCEPADREHLLDLYCGVGHFSHYLASYYGLVTGIEENNAVVAAARENAVINDSNNTVFIAGRVEGALARMAKNRPAPETIVLDPPRQGCLPEAIEGIAALSPQKVVYVSCNPATLARDLALLARHHYHVQALQPIDMFPHTHHIECVALIERQDS